MVQSNVMDFSTSIAAMQRLRTMLRDLWKRKLPTSRGRTVGAVTQKKNNCLNSWVHGDIEAKQSA